MSIAEVIKFEGPKGALVWKNSGKEYLISGNEKFNALSQLIVDEFYEAILFANGNALDLFKPGRYTLETSNIPMLSKMYENLVDGAPFPCKVYFINKVDQLELKWGTQGGITLNDPIYDIFLHIGCCGTMAVRVADSRRFLLKFVGNNDVFTNDNLTSKLRGIISSNVKNFISKFMIQKKVSFFDMNAMIFDIGLLCKEELLKIFEGYGISIEQFNIETIDVPKEDYEEITKAKSLNTSRRIQGFTWQEEQKSQIMKTAAANEGSAGSMMGAGMGLGMGVGMGGAMGQAFGQMSGDVFNTPASPQNQSMQQNQFNMSNGGEFSNPGEFFKPQPEQNNQNQNDGFKFCPSCGAKNPSNAMFCYQCGNKFEANVCPTCGATITPGAAFCCQCGTKIK